jgi:hypothetical protein
VSDQVAVVVEADDWGSLSDAVEGMNRHPGIGVAYFLTDQALAEHFVRECAGHCSAHGDFEAAHCPECREEDGLPPEEAAPEPKQLPAPQYEYEQQVDDDSGYLIEIRSCDAETGIVTGVYPPDRGHPTLVWTRLEPLAVYELIGEWLEGGLREIRVSGILGIGKRRS